MRIILASNNEDKSKEIKDILNKDILTLKDLNIDDEINEFGVTFEQNALIKAQYISNIYPEDFIIADDSGMEVVELNYEPGIYSKRYGKNVKGYIENPHKINNLLVLENLKGKENREARYCCSIAVVNKKKNFVQIFNGDLIGEIGNDIIEKNGFAYDQIFKYNDKYLSEYTSDEKNSFSHRNEALRKLKDSGVLDV